MRNNNEHGMTKGLVWGMLAGGVIGATLVMLTASKSGKEFRSDIRERTDRLLGDAQGFMDRARTKTSKAIEEAKKTSEEMRTGVSTRADTIMKEGSKLKHAVKAGVEAFKEESARG
jgi:gas vesicle protein